MGSLAQLSPHMLSNPHDSSNVMSTETSDDVSEAELEHSNLQGSDLRSVIDATHLLPLRRSFNPEKIIHGTTLDRRFQCLWE